MPEPIESAEERLKRERKQAQRIRSLLYGETPAAPARQGIDWSLTEGNESQRLAQQYQNQQEREQREQMLADIAERRRARQEQREARDARTAVERPRAYARGVGEGIEYDLMTHSNEADALQQGVTQGLTLGFADELGGAGRALLGPRAPGRDRSFGERYAHARDEVRGDVARAQEEAPGFYTAGYATGAILPSLALPQARAGSVAGRVLQAGAYGSGLGAAEGLGSSNASTLGGMAEDTLGGGARGFVGGAAGQLLGEGVQAAQRYNARLPQDPLLPSQVPQRGRIVRTTEEVERIRANPEIRRLEDERVQASSTAARHRLQGMAPGSTRTDVERALGGGYHGDAERLVDDLRAAGIIDPSDRPLGILPEGADLAQQRGRFVAEDTGRQVGESEAAATRAGATVDLAPAADRLRERARELRAQLNPTSNAHAAELEALADEWSAAAQPPLAPGRVPLTGERTDFTARGIMSGQDDLAGYARNAPSETRPYAQTQAREARGAIRGQMDEAMREALPPGEYEGAIRARSQNAAAQTINELAEAGRGRATGNRQVSFSDYQAMASAPPTLTGQALALIQNRLVRGREHTFMAMVGESRANALATQVARRLADAGDTRAATLLSAAARRADGARLIGPMIREAMERSPQGAQIVAEETQRIAPEVVEQLQQMANPSDPAGGFGGEPAPTQAEQPGFADPDDPAGGF